MTTNGTKNRLFTALCGLVLGVLIMAIAIIVGGQNVTANAEDGNAANFTPWTEYVANHKTITFSSKYSEPYKPLWLLRRVHDEPDDYSDYVVNIVNAPQSNANIRFQKGDWTGEIIPWNVYPLRPGTTSINLPAPDGTTVTVPVNITRDYFAAAFRNNSYFGIDKKNESENDNNILFGEQNYYGSDTVPYAQITIKAKGKTIKTTATATGDFKFKLAKFYKVGTKVNITYSANGISYTDKQKVKAWARLSHKAIYNKRSGRKMKIGFKATGLHKGDVVALKIGKEKTSVKIKKKGVKMIYIKTSSYSTNSLFTVTIKNKYKQLMFAKKMFL